MLDPIWLLLHILVLVYWLGGDLGAFYASRLVADPGRPPAGRAAAAAILMNVDMAPRMALIFAFPTGFALAVSRGWLEAESYLVAAAFAVAALWALLAWLVHLRAGPHALAARLDTAIRWTVLTALALAALGALAGLIDAPLFMAAKFALLALAIASGLMIRRALRPFGPAFARMAGGGGTPEDDAAIAASLAHAKCYVLVIWTALIAAALLGVYAPV